MARAEGLRGFAKRIQDLSDDALFSDVGGPFEGAENHNRHEEAVMHYLQAVAQLELAQRAIMLSAIALERSSA